jgi:hypothetical protein
MRRLELLFLHSESADGCRLGNTRGGSHCALRSPESAAPLIIQSGGWGRWNGRAEGSARSVVEFVAVEGERLRDAESCAQVIDEFERAASIVAVHPLAALVTLLRL